MIFITKIDSTKNKNLCVTEDDYGNWFGILYLEKVYIIILLDSWSLGGERIHI